MFIIHRWHALVVKSKSSCWVPQARNCNPAALSYIQGGPITWLYLINARLSPSHISLCHICVWYYFNESWPFVVMCPTIIACTLHVHVFAVQLVGWRVPPIFSLLLLICIPLNNVHPHVEPKRYKIVWSILV